MNFHKFPCSWLALALWLAAAVTVSAAGLRADERVVFIPSPGSQTAPGGGWELDIHAWAMEPESRSLGVFAFRKAMGLDKDKMTPGERARFNERARWFLVDNERHKNITLWLNERLQPVGKTEADGRLHVSLTLAAESVAKLRAAAQTPVIHFTTADTGGVGRSFHGEIHLCDPEGLSVISDIDDTIKVSEVRDQKALLRNTFVNEFKPVEGMAETYRAWMTNDGALFHYVSASPIQLYVPLADFVKGSSFPDGTWHLKDFRWKDESFFNLFVSPEEYKPGVIEPFFKRFPHRRFVLVGDSGEKDPEIYAALARKYPRQVVRILIRDTTGEARDSQRYQRVFQGLAPGSWQIFKEPSILPRTFK